MYNFSYLEGLILADYKIEFNQKKWVKSFFDGTISVLDVAYQLQVTSNKISCVYEL